MKRVGKLHVLTDTVLQKRFSHADLARLAIAGGADTIQYRQKQGSTREMIETASELYAICSDAGVDFVVNDRIDVAMASGAHGVHLGQDDFPIARAREILGPNVLIGGSAATFPEAEACLAQGADYIGFGPVFPTGSKDDAGPVSGLDALRKLRAMADVPIIAIGGIDESNAAAVVSAGAHGIAVISGVCCQDDPREAARRLGARLRAGQGG